MHKLDPSVKTVWALSIITRTIVYSIIIFIFEFFIIKNNIEGWPVPAPWISIGVFALGLLLTFIFPAIKYKYWYFDVREDELFLHRGVITRITTTAPFNRIQHIDVEQGVIERMLDLGKLVIYTAGTRGADLLLPGLPIGYAEALRDRLKNNTAEDEV
ncbi:MAG: PH domain-containing protein [Candidatus Kapaibacterium sp.]